MKIQNLQDLKKSISIVDVLSKYIDLKQISEDNWRGICPFHEDHTPSLSVLESKKIFKCFACDTSGDVFTFVQKIKNISFSEAINEVCKHANVQFNNTFIKQNKKNIEEIEKNQPYWNICKLIENVCYRSLYNELQKNNQNLINFLNQHELTSKIIDQFHIGFIPNDDLFFKKKIINGFEKEKDKTQFIKLSHELGFDYNLFLKRNSIIVPIHKRSNVIGFDVWDIVENNLKNNEHTLTKNSVIFQKNQEFFNLDNLRTNYTNPLTNNIVHITSQTLDTIKLFKNNEKNVVTLLSWPWCDKKQVNLLVEKNVNQIILHSPQYLQENEINNNNIASVAQQFMKAGITNVLVSENKNQQDIFKWYVSKLKINNNLNQDEKVKKIISYVVQTIPNFAQTKIINQHLQELNFPKSLNPNKLKEMIYFYRQNKTKESFNSLNSSLENQPVIIYGFVKQIITYKNKNNDEFKIIKLLIPNKVHNINNALNETAHVNVEFYKNPELNNQIKDLIHNDYIALKGEWCFYNYGTENKQNLRLGFNATDIQLVKKQNQKNSDFNKPQTQLQIQ